MNKSGKITFFLLLLLSFDGTVFAGINPRQEVKNTILIGWDGADRKDLTLLLSKGKLPNLEKLINEGCLVNIEVTTGKTQTKPGWAEILTGNKAEDLGIFSNKDYKPIPRGYSIFERLKAYIGNDKIVTLFIGGKDYNIGARGKHQICDNCVKRESVTRENTIFFDKIYKGLTGDETSEHWVPREGEPYFYSKEAIDLHMIGLGGARNVTREALTALERLHDKTFFAFIQFEEPDERGHRYGENSALYSQAFQITDYWLGVIVKKLKLLGIYDKTVIYVTADHGMDKGAFSHERAPDIFLATNSKRKLTPGDRKDITPTILSDYGIDLEKITPKLDGTSLFIKDNISDSVELKRTKLSSITSPFVLKEGMTYKMWFKMSSPGFKQGIYYATSTDGINWVKQGSNPVIAPGEKGWERQQTGSPALIIDNNKYLMWYRGDGDGLQQTGYAVSIDGVNWKKYTDNPVFKVGKNSWDNKSVIAKHIFYDRGIYKMYYRGSRQLDQDFSSIGLATSGDGIVWKRSGDRPVLNPGAPGDWDDKQVGDPMVLYNDVLDLYQMWYSGESYRVNSALCRETGKNGSGYGKMVGYATSKDGIHWEKYQYNPVVRTGEKGSWDFVKVDNPFVMFDEGIYKMYYRGSDGQVDGIGYASSKDGINWQKHSDNPLLKQI